MTYNDNDWPCCPRRLGSWPCCWSFNLGQLLLTLCSLRFKCICQCALTTRMTCKFTCIDHEIYFISVRFKHLPYFHCQELVPLSLEESCALCQLLWVNLEIRSRSGQSEDEVILKIYPSRYIPMLFNACFKHKLLVSSDKNNYRSPNPERESHLGASFSLLLLSWGLSQFVLYWRWWVVLFYSVFSLLNWTAGNARLRTYKSWDRKTGEAWLHREGKQVGWSQHWPSPKMWSWREQQLRM